MKKHTLNTAVLTALLAAVSALFLATGCSSGGKAEVPVTYFFASHCNDCEEIGERLKVLPDRIRVDGERVTLRVELLNVLTDPGWEALTARLETEAVPLSDRNVPLLFIGSLWFYGEEEIDGAVTGLEQSRLPPGLPEAPASPDN